MMQKALRRMFDLLILTTFFTLLLAAGTVHAATFTVTNTNDSGAGSLRQAILDANAATGADVIVFDAGVFSTPQTITLTTDQLFIDDNLTINGPGAALLSISGNNQFRSFLIRGIDGPVTVSISNMTIKDGNAGGGAGIRANESGTDFRVVLNVSGVVFQDNTNNSGASGGGIFMAQSTTELYVNNSIFRRNIGNSGGGIACGSGGGGCVALTITNTLFEENVAGGFGGAGFTCCGNGNPVSPIVLENVAFIRNSGGNNGMVMRLSHPTTQFIFRNMTVAHNNSGVSGNTAALQLEFGHFSFENSTIAYNTNAGTGGSNVTTGINSTWPDTVISFRNTIVAKNTNANGLERDISAQDRNLGRLDSLGYNIFGTLVGNTVITGNTTGNQIGVNPLLDRIPRENGSFLKTLALRPGSPAIDAADPANFRATDQRGVARPVDGDGNGTALPDIGAFEKTASDIVSQTALFDYEGDGRSDVSIFRPGPGQWWYLRSSDGSNRAFTFGQGTDEAVPADLTGDGKTDLAFFRPSSGEWYVLRSEDSTFYAFPFGANGDVPVPGDFDGDGRADAGVFRPSNNTWYVSLSSGGTSITGFGANGDKPILADFDADGKNDIAIYRPMGGTGGGEWWYLRSSDGQSRAFAFGSSTDKAVAGDYTGDGRTDLAFWRPSTGEWYVMRSEDNSFYAFPFGISTDTPVPADYDGDGRIDAAVFRSSNNTWYLQRSTAGFEALPFGTAGDRPLPNTFVR